MQCFITFVQYMRSSNATVAVVAQGEACGSHCIVHTVYTYCTNLSVHSLYTGLSNCCTGNSWAVNWPIA